MIEIKNLSVTYKEKTKSTKVLGPVDLSIHQGEIVVLIGPSGCGKSTLLGVLGGIINAYQGEVCWDEQGIDYRKRCIGYVPQDYGLLPWKSVYQNCMMPYKIKKMKVTEEIKGEIEDLLVDLGLGQLKDRYPSALSGGQRQRVAIARAFSSISELLLLDEPFSALDAIKREEATEIFLRLWKKQNCTTVMVTHSIEEALYMAHKIVVMSDVPGTIKKVISNPLFGKEDFREYKEFKSLHDEIKGHIKGGGVGEV